MKGFSIKEYNTQTGLYDFGFRFYSPQMPRWTTRDPLGEAGGLNLYAFVGNNPVNWVDPWGLAPGGMVGTYDMIYRPIGLPPLPPGVVAGSYGAAGAGALAWLWHILHSDAVEDDDCDAGEDAPTWPNSPEEMDDLLDIPGEKVPDGPTTPGRNKVTWEPNKDTKITYEEHPYHPNAPDWHKGPHWHLDTPGNPHIRYLPGENIPGY